MTCPNCNRAILPKERVGICGSEGPHAATIAHIPSICKKEKAQDADTSKS